MRFDMNKNNNNNNSDDEEDDDLYDDDDDSFDGIPGEMHDDKLRFMEMGYLQEKLEVDLSVALIAQAKEIASNSFFWKFKSMKSKMAEIQVIFQNLVMMSRIFEDS